MPLGHVEQYIGEFSTIPMPRWAHMVFTGGEAMAPYFHRMYEYIPKCLEITTENNMVPFVKTNGIWGTDKNMRTRILHDFANAAYKSNTLMSMDISVDEFHNNLDGVTAIINDIIQSDYLAPAIRLSLVGLNTNKSYYGRFSELLRRLRACGLKIQRLDDGALLVGKSDSWGMMIYYDFHTGVANVGRGAKNSLGAYVPDGRPDSTTGHCLQIDNKDIATLNYRYTAPVAGRPVYDVTRQLLQRVH